MLTFDQTRYNLRLSLPHEAVEFGSSFSQGQKRPLLSVVFLCLPKIINTGLVRINHVMVGVLGSFRACWFLDPVFQLNTSTTRCLEASGGSLKTTVKELAMSQHSHTQTPTIHVSHKTQSCFNTHQQAKQLIASSHDIAYSAKLVQHDLVILIESTKQIEDVMTNSKELTDSILVELEKTRGVLAESIAICNKLYHKGLDAMKECAL